MSSAKPVPSSVPHTDNQLSEFLLKMCHDLRGPLRAIRTHGELMVKHVSAAGSQARGPLDFIMDGSLKAGLLVEGLTQYSLALQIDPANFQPVPLGVMFRSAMAKLAAVVQETGASVTYDTMPIVAGNADRIIHLFEELLDNALRNRGHEPPRIHAGAERRATDWLIRVGDNGPGVEAEFLDRVFTPFERVHGKERPGPGLATCRVIVERHGGSIWAESNPSAFCFTLPAEQD